MDRTAKRIAAASAIVLFFVMALAGWLYGQEPAECAWRSVIGAAAIYLAVRIAGNLTIRIIIEAMAQDQMRRRGKP